MIYSEMDCLKKAVRLFVENTKIEAYATSHLKSDNEGEPWSNTSFTFYLTFLPPLILERECLYISSFVLFLIFVGHEKKGKEASTYKVMIYSEMDCLKKAVRLFVENTKIEAYATSHLKCHNEGEPWSNTSFTFYLTFLPPLILERECLYISSFVLFLIFVGHEKKGKEASTYKVMIYSEMDCLKKAVRLFVENTKIEAYATSHLKCHNEGEPWSNTSFTFYLTFLPPLILERECLYISSFLLFLIFVGHEKKGKEASTYKVMIYSEMDCLKKAVRLFVENTKIEAYATSHLKCHNEGEPWSNTSFTFYLTFLPPLILERECLYISSFVLFLIFVGHEKKGKEASTYKVMIYSEMDCLKKAVRLFVENTKIEAYATSHLKCHNEGEPWSNTSFTFYLTFLPPLILERECLYISSFVLFLIFVGHEKKGKEASTYKVMIYSEMDCLKKAVRLFVENTKIEAYATSHLKCHNEGEPWSNTSFTFYLTFLPPLILERECLYISSFVLFLIFVGHEKKGKEASTYKVMIYSEMDCLKKAVRLFVENTKIEAYATSHLKCHNEGEPWSNTSFTFYLTFLPPLILERECLYISSFVLFLIFVGHENKGKEASTYKVMIYSEMDCLKKAVRLFVENTKIEAYATSHLKCHNEGEPWSKTSFTFYLTFLPPLILERECLYISSFVLFLIFVGHEKKGKEASTYKVMIYSEMDCLKKAVRLFVENTKIEAYATSHLKCHNEGEPWSNTSFTFYLTFLPPLILERECLYISSFVLFLIFVGHEKKGKEASTYKVMIYSEMDCLKKAVRLFVENTKIEAYATSHLKCHNEGEPWIKYIFYLLSYFLATIDSWKGMFVHLIFCIVSNICWTWK